MNYIKSMPSKNGKKYIPTNKDKYVGSYPIWIRRNNNVKKTIL